ncbi:hypothetical protein [Kineococcus aurantiacus]|uniref:Uncharacterized protein n=1 Tax=Kineococcus aurantiacus TaxID=37633 RepID=A0A7Y9DKL1_9ACTN|nr:hypothetical protein [Kineococcus aurantiacus]NYD22317.1 hypothetical protein [Kineococcus aurantiacus]
MSTLDDTPAARGAQTVAPIQASALLHAASILGEASYTPEQELHGTLSATRHEAETPQPVAAPAPVAEPVPAPVAEPVAEPAPVEVPAPVEAPAKGFFARLLDKLLGRG